jgi:hypothetical protein
MLRVALTLSAVVAYAPQRATKQTVRSAPLQQPRGLTTVSASSLEPEADGGFDLVQGATDLTLTALRVGTCALMIHHGFDKIENVEGFSANVVAKFFGFLPGPPQFWTLSAAVTQIVGAGFLSVGLFARPVALSMVRAARALARTPRAPSSRPFRIAARVLRFCPPSLPRFLAPPSTLPPPPKARDDAHGRRLPPHEHGRRGLPARGR